MLLLLTFTLILLPLVTLSHKNASLSAKPREVSGVNIRCTYCSKYIGPFCLPLTPHRSKWLFAFKGAFLSPFIFEILLDINYTS